MNRMFSLLSGIFTVLNTFQVLLFDLNQVVWISYDDQYSIFWEVNSKMINWILANEVKIHIVLSLVTMASSLCFLYCLHTQRYVGLAVHSVWLLLYELLSLSLRLLSKGLIKNQFKELIYFKFIFQVLRMALHFLALPFILRHMHSLYKGAKSRAQVSGSRQSSSSVNEARFMRRQGLQYPHRLV